MNANNETATARKVKCEDCIWLRWGVPSVDGCPHTCLGVKEEHPVGSMKYEYLGVKDKDVITKGECEYFAQK